jgi:hypothetical protein
MEREMKRIRERLEKAEKEIPPAETVEVFFSQFFVKYVSADGKRDVTWLAFHVLHLDEHIVDNNPCGIPNEKLNGRLLLLMTLGLAYKRDVNRLVGRVKDLEEENDKLRQQIEVGGSDAA